MNRIDWIDCAKGIAIILVVIGHVLTGYRDAEMFTKYWIVSAGADWIYSFHMALFFVTSGFVFEHTYFKKEKDDKRKVFIAILELIIIYLFYSFLLVFTKVLLYSEVNFKFKVSDIFSIYKYPVGLYWYLYTLIIFYVFVMSFHKQIIKFWKGTLFIALGISAFALFVIKDSIAFQIKNITYFFVFFLIGILMRHFNYMFKREWLIVLLAAFLIITVLCFINDKCFQDAGFIQVIMSFLGSAVILGLSQIIKKIPIVNYLGKNSLYIYLLHIYITAGFRILFIQLKISNIIINCWISIIFALFFPVIFSIIGKKNRYIEMFFKPIRTIYISKNHT